MYISLTTLTISLTNTTRKQQITDGQKPSKSGQIRHKLLIY
jgi:hypothetical protein